MAQSNGLGFLRRKAVGALRNATANINYEHHHWFVVWNVTWACNLACEYCTSRSNIGLARLNPAGVRNGLEAVTALDPRCVILFGGEPTLCGGLPDALRQIRDGRPNVFLQLNTNGVRAEHVCEIIPVLDMIEVSLDSLDESHPLIPNFNPSSVMSKIERYADVCKRTNTAILIDVVVTKHNFRQMPAMIDWVKKNLPNSGMNLRPLVPFTHPLSVQSDPQTNEEFTAIARDLTGSGYAEVHTERIRYEGRKTCHKQFFQSYVDDRGIVTTCKTAGHIATLEDRLRNGKWTLGSALRGFADLSAVSASLVVRPHAPICWRTCDWAEFFNDFLWGKAPADDPHLFFLHGRLDPQDLETIAGFAKKHLNRTIPLGSMEPFLSSETAIGFGRKTFP